MITEYEIYSINRATGKVNVDSGMTLAQATMAMNHMPNYEPEKVWGMVPVHFHDSSLWTGRQ